MAAGKNGYIDVTVMPQSVGKVRVYWQEDYDVAENCSTITITDVQGYLWHRAAWAYLALSVTADYDTVLPNTDGRWMFSANADTTLRSVCSASDLNTPWSPVTSEPIYHNDDGSKAVTLTVTLHDCWAPDVGFDGENGQTTSQSVVLTAIPRVSGVSATGGEIGQALSVSVQKSAADFLHTLRYSFAGKKGVIVERTARQEIQWTPPVSLCSQLPNANSGTCTITCETYSGDSLVGTASCDVELTVPESVGLSLSDGWAVAAPYNTGTAAAGLNVYVQGYSKAQVTFNSGNISTAKAYGAAVKSYQILCNGKTVSASPYRTNVLNLSGDTKIQCSVTDTRGRTQTATLTVSVERYSYPTLSGVKVFRCKSNGTAADDGTYISVKATAKISSVAGLNSGNLRVRYRVQGGSYGSYTTLTSAAAKVIGGGGVAAASTYEAEVSLTDKLGNKAVVTVIVPTADVFFHGRDGGKGAAFGKYSEEDDLLDVDWNLRVRKNLILDGGLTAAYPVAPRNLLDNSDFTNPINQRGISGTFKGTSGKTVYFLDRWRTWSTLTHYTPSAAGLKIISNYSESLGPAQIYEHPEKMLGKTYTLAVCYDDDVIDCGTVTVPSAASDSDYYLSAIATAAGKIGLRFYAAADLSVIYFQIMIAAGDTHTVKWVACYEGEYTLETLPPYIPKGYAAELLECQRYYENSWFGCPDGKNTRIANWGTAWSVTQADVHIPYKAPKRIQPTVMFYSEGSLTNWTVYHGGQHMPVSAITDNKRYGINKLVARMTRDSTNDTAWTAGDTMETRGHWEASADL